MSPNCLKRLGRDIITPGSSANHVLLFQRRLENVCIRDGEAQETLFSVGLGKSTHPVHEPTNFRGETLWLP